LESSFWPLRPAPSDMLALFCLRLALGMVACLPLLFSSGVQARFYRTHFLTLLGLVALAGVFLAEQADTLLWCFLGADLLLGLAGAVAFSAEGAPGGRTCVVLTSLALLG